MPILGEVMRLSIAILTGRRLDLLQRTVKSLEATNSGLLNDSYVIIYLNGFDNQTDHFVRSLSYVDDYMYVASDTPEPIGAAVSRMTDHVIGKSDYHIHLEDDWECMSSGFIGRAQSILENHPEIGQVRLRHKAEPVMRFHMVSQVHHRWARKDGVLMSKLHFTFNPSLVRTEDLNCIYPATSEIDAASNYAKRFSFVAQDDPGAFRHIGGDASLRCHLGR